MSIFIDKEKCKKRDGTTEQVVINQKESNKY